MLKYLVLGINEKKQFPQDISPLRHPPPPPPPPPGHFLHGLVWYYFKSVYVC